VVAKKVCRISRKQAHDSTFFVDVSPIGCYARSGVNHSRVRFGRDSAWFYVDREVTISIDASQNSLSRDTHRPGLHAAVDSTRASFADEGRKISNFNVAEHRGNAKKVLGPRELKTFDSVTLIEPGGSNCVSGVKEVTWEEKEFGGERINWEQPGVPDLYPFGNSKILFTTRAHIVSHALDEFVVTRSEDIIKRGSMTNRYTKVLS
jgi:hypothetical protein